MSLTTLPPDMIRTIIKMIPDNKGTIALYNSCNIIRKDCINTSFLKKIMYNNHKTISDPNNWPDPESFSILWHNHASTIKCIETDGLDNIEKYIPVFAEEMIITYYETSEAILSPENGDRVKKLFFKDFAIGSKRTLKIDWAKFPNLEELTLHVWDVDITGMKELCPKLRKTDFKGLSWF